MKQQIRKTCYGTVQADRIEQELRLQYNDVKCIACPIFGCSPKGSLYVWSVGSRKEVA